MTTLQRLLNVRTTDGVVEQGRRRITIGAFPMGVDAASLAQRGAEPQVLRQRDDLPNQAGAGALLLGIDRLDYTKGIPRRLLAFEQLLRRHPEWQGRVGLLQLAGPSRADVRNYRSFREEVDGLVGRINGEFGTPQWMPIHYLYRSVPEVQLLSFYRAADVMLVTPVRDGMNLVAKEFVATREDGDGVLVLSEFAGAAAELDQALQVNPYDLKESAEVYHRALTMTRVERKERMRALRASVFEHDVHHWVASFLHQLTAGPVDFTHALSTPPPTSTDVGAPAASENALAAWPELTGRLAAGTAVVFLDYDGTLTRIVREPGDAVLSANMRRTLQQLCEQVPVALVSGRGREDLARPVALPDLIYAGSHGFDIAGPNGLARQTALELVPVVREAGSRLQTELQYVEGVVIEEKRFSVAVHYRMVAQVELSGVFAPVDALLQDQPRLERRYGKKVIELRPAVEWDKGYAVRWITARITPADEVIVPIYIGDDLTDEDAFAAIAEDGVSIMVSERPRSTRAQYTLRDVNEVQSFLDQLTLHRRQHIKASRRQSRAS